MYEMMWPHCVNKKQSCLENYKNCHQNNYTLIPYQKHVPFED